MIGDACHPMSMFKGQGANQAIEDAPLLASWLGKPGLNSKNVLTRIRCFEREMLSRALPKVSASREAAVNLHHVGILTEKGQIEGALTGIDGVFEEFRKCGVNAHLGAVELNKRALCVVERLQENALSVESK